MREHPEIDRFGAIVGSDPAMKSVFSLIEKASQVDMPVLIAGETGVGKDLIAHEIVARSARNEAPYIALNTGTLSRELMLSELFGHVKGAFTGATDDKRGRFEEADGGTLFLDEISTMDDRVQVALLRVLQKGVYRPVGAKKDRQADVRILAASNADLRAAAQRGQFRQDLMHRLEVLEISVPPLRNRLSDVRQLAYAFLGQVAEEYGFEVVDIADDTMQALQAYAWPGNVRELKNVIAQAALMSAGKTLRVQNLPQRVRQRAVFASEPPAADSPEMDVSSTAAPKAGPVAAQAAGHEAADGLFIPTGLPLARVEKEYVLKTLADCDNNKTEAARTLGISRKTLYDRLARWEKAEPTASQ